MTVHTRRAPYAGWRALAATVLVMTGAVGAHTWAGGHVPPWQGLALLAAVLLASSRVLLGGTGSWRSMLPLVVAAQACLHTPMATLGEPAAHGGHASHQAAGAPGAAETMGMMPAPWSGRMLAAHAFVALLTLLVWHLCARAAVAVVRLLAIPAPLVVRTAAARPTTTPDLADGWSVVLLSAPRRGPPLVAGHR